MGSTLFFPCAAKWHSGMGLRFAHQADLAFHKHPTNREQLLLSVQGTLHTTQVTHFQSPRRKWPETDEFSLLIGVHCTQETVLFSSSRGKSITLCLTYDLVTRWVLIIFICHIYHLWRKYCLRLYTAVFGDLYICTSCTSKAH